MMGRFSTVVTNGVRADLSVYGVSILPRGSLKASVIAEATSTVILHLVTV